MTFLLGALGILIILAMLYFSIGGKMLGKIFIFRFWLIIEYLKILSEAGFPLREFEIENRNITPQELLSQIGVHYKLTCSFKLNIIQELGIGSNGGSIAGSIGMPRELPDPNSKEFKNFTFNVNLGKYWAEGTKSDMSVILGHEVAHAYLFSHRIENYRSELMTDVCAMAAGFSENYNTMSGIRISLNKSGAEEGIKTFAKEQFDNFKRGGNEYISKWEIPFTKLAIWYFAFKKHNS